jgi:A/G-specific adenine glycosylase
LTSFQTAVLDWYDEHRRDLPWRDVDDGYAVLVSEIMLQQTQVSRVIPKYSAFLARWPTPTHLAAASRAEVVREWQGLGDNRRAVALHRAAQAIVERHGGVVPRDLPSLLSLPGIGAYTARAVLAFAYGEHAAPVDTNVARVVVRGIEGSPLRGAALQHAADAAVPRGRSRDWSAALMDLGSTHCTVRPRCEDCPVAPACAWAQAGADDPAGRVTRAPQPFVGSNRYHRGRLLDALRVGAVARDALAPAAALEDAARAAALAAGLVADGLAEWDGPALRLPA